MIWRWLGLFVATLSLTWLVLLWRLQNRSDIPEGVLWVYFAGLPLLVFGLLAGFIWAFRRAYVASQNKHKPAAQTADADVASSPAAEANTRQAPALAAVVLYAGARNMAGAQAAEILDGLREGKLFPVPDAELLNWAGMPVVTARIAELEAEFETLTPAFSGDGAGASFSDVDDIHDNTHAPIYVLRSAAALQPLLHEAFTSVGQWPAADAGAVADAHQEEDTSAYHSALLRPAREQSACSVHVLAAVDEGWPAQSVHSFSHWLEQAVHEQAQQAACAVSFELVHGSAALWQAGRDFVQARQVQLARAGGAVQPASYLLLLASHSDLDEEWVALYENKGVLFSAQDNARGYIPGEAAAALLLHVWTGVCGPAESTEQAVQRALGPLLYWPEVRLVNQATGATDTSRDTNGAGNGAGGATDRTPSGNTPSNGAGDVASGLLAEGMQSALQAAGVAAASVAGLCCDADRHSRQATELFGMTWAVLPQLDPLEHIGMAGVSGGHMGAAASVLACALAVEAASQQQAPCAFASVQDARVRVAGCVVPQGWTG